MIPVVMFELKHSVKSNDLYMSSLISDAESNVYKVATPCAISVRTELVSMILPETNKF